MSGDDRPARLLVIHDRACPPDTLILDLRGKGYTVDQATSDDLGPVAQLLRHVILVDVPGADGSGAQTCGTLRSLGCSLPVIVIAECAGPHDHVRALDAGADDFLQKPFNVVELCARIRAVMRRATPVIQRGCAPWPTPSPFDNPDGFPSTLLCEPPSATTPRAAARPPVGARRPSSARPTGHTVPT